MEIRLLEDSEWFLLEPIFKQNGASMPSPEMAKAAVAMDEKGVAGFWVIQMIAHAEPIWVREDCRGNGLWEKMHGVIESIFDKTPGTGYYCLTDDSVPQVSSIAKKLGLVEVPNFHVWRKEF